MSDVPSRKTKAEMLAMTGEELDAYVDAGGDWTDGAVADSTNKGPRPAELPTWDETEYLMSSPENARRLTDAIERLSNGEGVERDLAEGEECE